MNQNFKNKTRRKSQSRNKKSNQIKNELLRNGVSIVNPDSLEIRGELSCGDKVEIDINVLFEGKVRLGNGVRVGANCILKNCNIGNGTIVNPFSIIEDADLGKDCLIGPYGLIHSETSLDNNVQIGNFVELENSTIGSASRINHLSFIGDSNLSDQVTIGAGVIVSNHNDYSIKKTVLKERAFIGSGTTIVGPIKINRDSTVGAGSTITEDTPSNKLTLARAKQNIGNHGSNDF